MSVDLPTKRRAVECYRSQVGPLGVGVDASVNAPERIRRLVPHLNGGADREPCPIGPIAA